MQLGFPCALTQGQLAAGSLPFLRGVLGNQESAEQLQDTWGPGIMAVGPLAEATQAGGRGLSGPDTVRLPTESWFHWLIVACTCTLAPLFCPDLQEPPSHCDPSQGADHGRCQ